MEVQPAFELMVSALSDITLLPFIAGGVVALTAVTKRYVPVSASALALFFQVIIWIAWVAAKESGFDMNQFETLTTAFVTILTTAGGIVASQAVATPFIYEKAVQRNVAGLGYSRSQAAADDGYGP